MVGSVLFVTEVEFDCPLESVPTTQEICQGMERLTGIECKVEGNSVRPLKWFDAPIFGLWFEFSEDKNGISHVAIDTSTTAVGGWADSYFMAAALKSLVELGGRTEAEWHSSESYQLPWAKQPLLNRILSRIPFL